ncbi:hypothetical protein WN943_014326 [Citrus x changshan-huyou]
MALLSVLIKQLLQPYMDASEIYNHPLSISLLLLLLLLTLVQLLKITRHSRNHLKLPTSPPKLPILGNLHQLLGTIPHRSLKALSERYGPLMFVYFGNSPTLVVSSAELASEMIKTHDIVISNRPKTTPANILLYECRDVGFANYGEYWRKVRKICVLQLLNVRRVQSFQHIRDDEVSSLVNKIRNLCLNGGSINLTEMLLAVTNNIVSRCALGRRVEEENGKSNFGEVSRTLVEQLTAFCIGDVFPSLGWIDALSGLNGRLNATARALEDMLDQDMFVGGTDTTATALEWAMAELVKNPTSMKRAQEEIRSVMKGKSKIHMKDIEKMDYLKCVVKETLRLHPSLPLLVPRETATNLKWRGYDIPAKTRVFVNAWAIQRDPQVWDNPEDFLPDRFVNNTVDLNGQNFQFIPFGAGRRGCPGISFALAAIEYVIANLLYWFDWKLPRGEVLENLDMIEVSGLAVHKKLALHLVPTLYSPYP